MSDVKIGTQAGESKEKKLLQPQFNALVQALTSLRNESIRASDELRDLQDEQAKMVALLDALDDEVWYCDREGDIIYTNCVARQWLPHEGVHAFADWAVTTNLCNGDGLPYDLKNNLPPILRSLQGEEVRRELERRHHPKTGLIHFYEVNSTSVRDSDDTILGAVASCRDVTERRKTEQQAQLLHALLVSLSSPTSVTQAAEVVLQQVLGIFRGTMGFVTLLSEASEIAHIVAQSGLPEDFTEVYHRSNEVSTASAAQSAFSEIASWSETSEEYASQLPDLYKRLALHLGAKSALSLPLVDGTIVVIFQKPTAFSSEDRFFHEIVAKYCAQALDRAQLYERGLVVAVEQERLHLSRDLHDSVTQTLWTTTIIAETLKENLDSFSSEILQGHLDQLFYLNRGALAEMRNLLLQLRPQHWETFTIQEAITQLVNSAIGFSPIQFSLTMPDQPFLLAPNIVRNVFYLLKEALHNVAKHAEATKLEIILEQQGKNLVFTVTDNGQGFDPTVQRLGIGLRSMQERATEIGANFQIKSIPGSGTQIIITLPYSG